MKKKIAIIGLGYVGLPLVNAFKKKFDVLGFDISLKRINELKNNINSNNQFIFSKNDNFQNVTFF